MRDWRGALQSGTMRNVVAAVLLLDAAGLYLAHQATSGAVADEALLDDGAAVPVDVAAAGESDFLPPALPRPQASVRVEFSDIPSAVARGHPGAAPALAFEALRPEPIDLGSDGQDAGYSAPAMARQAMVRPAISPSLRLALSRPAPAAYRPASHSPAGGFAAAFPATDTMASQAPSPAADQTVAAGAAPAIVLPPATTGGLEEQPAAALDSPPPEADPSLAGQPDPALPPDAAAPLPAVPDAAQPDGAGGVELPAELPA